MSGHSKWAKIKRDKGSKDAQRGVLFSKLSKKISIAAKAGGNPDPALNFQLRTEIESAKAQGMPNDNIDRAIKRAFDKNESSISENTYEGYGPFATAFIVKTATDNTNRTVQNIKHIFTKHGGSLGAIGSVAWQFTSKGQILIETTKEKVEELELLAIDAGAVDVKESEDGLEVYTTVEDLEKVKEQLTKAKVNIVDSSIIKESSQPVSLDDSQKPKVESLIEDLESSEDVIAVHTSANL